MGSDLGTEHPARLVPPSCCCSPGAPDEEARRVCDVEGQEPEEEEPLDAPEPERGRPECWRSCSWDWRRPAPVEEALRGAGPVERCRVLPPCIMDSVAFDVVEPPLSQS